MGTKFELKTLVSFTLKLFLWQYIFSMNIKLFPVKRNCICQRILDDYVYVWYFNMHIIQCNFRWQRELRSWRRMVLPGRTNGRMQIKPCWKWQRRSESKLFDSWVVYTYTWAEIPCPNKIFRNCCFSVNALSSDNLKNQSIPQQEHSTHKGLIPTFISILY